ncbi:hypothetical protein ACFCYH_12170 [Streptomyces sp. NPDC056400]|uniref:hypothetical protein n=1 Tax=Streptomyces sp. NPDC056400 TaxID=3345808 RepID=UPI0035DA5702
MAIASRPRPYKRRAPVGSVGAGGKSTGSSSRPVRKDWLSGVAYRADVRVRRVGGEDRGTWGAEPTIYYFHPGDVHRAAPAIAEGRVDIPSDWRTDTPDGRRAEFWGMLIARVAGTLVIAALLGGIFLILGTVIFALTVE